MIRRELVRIGGYAIVAAMVALGYTAFRVWSQGETDERRPADVIVVLGAAQYDGRPSPVFAARLDHAVSLYLAGIAPVLVVTGGKAEGDRTTEAAVARAYAIAHGVPPGAILSEDRGRTTLGSLEAVAAILSSHGLRSAVFVSDRSHMLRVLRISTDLGIRGWGSPTTTSPSDGDPESRLAAMVHEVGALLAYFLEGGRPAGDMAVDVAR